MHFFHARMITQPHPCRLVRPKIEKSRAQLDHQCHKPRMERYLPRRFFLLGSAEFLRHAHRALPFRRDRHHAAILHALQSRHYQNRIRAGAREGVLNSNVLTFYLSLFDKLQAGHKTWPFSTLVFPPLLQATLWSACQLFQSHSVPQH